MSFRSRPPRAMLSTASAIAAFFYIRTLATMFTGTTSEARATTPARSTIALLIVAAAILLVGVMPWTITSIAMAGS